MNVLDEELIHFHERAWRPTSLSFLDFLIISLLTGYARDYENERTMDGLGLDLGRLGRRAHHHIEADSTGLVSGGGIDETLVQVTSEFIDQLQWSAAKSIRTSVVTLAAFNVVAAFATLACILWDCWTVKKKSNNPTRYVEGIEMLCSA